MCTSLYSCSATLDFSVFKKVGVFIPLFFTFKANRNMGVYVGEEGSHHNIKVLKLENWANVCSCTVFIKLQECILRKRLAESAGWKLRAALWPAGAVFLRGSGGRVCVCARADVHARACPLWQLFQTAAEKPPQQ